MPCLRRTDLAGDPLEQFHTWFAEAGAAGVAVPEAVALATATAAGRPSVRMVLLKGADERGFTVYTNLESRKGSEIGENPRAALLFHWQPLGRQVRVEGRVAAVPDREADAYFDARPVGARFAAAASEQSRPVDSRATLEGRVRELERRYGHGGPPRPRSWGGVRIVPEAYEFWQHRDNRLHDRFRYRDGPAWAVERLQP